MVSPTEEGSEFVGRILLSTISHPIEYAKVLIQIGYEPIAPRKTVTWFRRPALGLPNIFQYVRYISEVEGFTGCYRGLMPKLCAYTINAIACEVTPQYIVFQNEPSAESLECVPEECIPPYKRLKKCFYNLVRDLISRTVGIIVSHPFEVITLRMMAQMVGGETKYNGLIRSIIEVYRDSGVMGYYSGLVPRLIGNAATLILVSSSTYVINKYVIEEPDLKPYTSSTMTFLVSTVTYPFSVVSHCMAVNNCGLVAGMPPQMPIYKDWLHCWSHLSANNQLSRGNSLFWRYYLGAVQEA